MSVVRIVVAFFFFAITTSVTMLLLVPLLPFRTVRIKLCNYYGKFVGRGMVWISGCPVTHHGLEHLDASRPAIYVSNHTSGMDAFFAMYLSPVGTVGIVKKQILYYPFFGQLYFLSGHLRIDRSNIEAAKRSMAALCRFVVDNRLSIYVWPEGTRSKSGQLQSFKKGMVHLATQTGLPVVPIVIEGVHEAWVKGSLKIAPVDVKVTVLPPIDTSTWHVDTMETHLTEVREAFRAVLPPGQRGEG